MEGDSGRRGECWDTWRVSRCAERSGGLDGVESVFIEAEASPHWSHSAHWQQSNWEKANLREPVDELDLLVLNNPENSSGACQTEHAEMERREGNGCRSS